MLQIQPFTRELQQKWDDFVRLESVNGTFLQTKNFLDYHPPERFEDASFLLENEKGHIVAVVSGCSLTQEGEKVFFSHKGSTFGGIVVSKRYYKAENVLEIIDAVECYLNQKEYDKVVLKQTSSLFSWVSSDLMDYCLFQKGYGHYAELSTYVDFSCYKDDVLANFSQSKRSCIRNMCSENLTFRALEQEAEQVLFYEILCENLKKFESAPVHTFPELRKLLEEHIKGKGAFFGVFQEEELLAGSLVFFFENNLVHTQYLATNPNYLKKQPMMYLIYCLLEEMKTQGISKVSFGTSTQEQGKRLNLGLMRAKESYGSLYSNNYTYTKQL